jgi:hypothetical protein
MNSQTPLSLDQLLGKKNPTKPLNENYPNHKSRCCLIIDKATGEAFENWTYTDSITESIRLARLTWYNLNLWNVVPGQGEITAEQTNRKEIEVTENNFRNQVAMANNPFRQLLLQTKTKT